MGRGARTAVVVRARRRVAWLSVAALSAIQLGAPRVAFAAPKAKGAEVKARTTLIYPAVIAAGGALHAPTLEDAELGQLATSLDPLLADAAQDLGLVVGHAPRPAPDPAHLGDAELAERARASGEALVLPSLRVLPPRVGAPSLSEVELRLVVANGATGSVLVRAERVAREEVPVRAVVLLRDLVADLEGGASCSRGAAREAATGVVTTPTPRGSGRNILLVASTLFGGFAGYSIQRASGSSDPRILYPLIAASAGIGLGASVVASEEWEVTRGEAWYVAAGATWPMLAGHLLYQGRFSPRVESDRWVFGLVGGTTGITLSVLGLTLHGMSEGGALLAHSGGSLGLFFGGLTEALVHGDIGRTPFSGMGYGAGLGWLTAAAVATQIRIAPARLLTIDIGALLGGLGGAAIASPLVVGDSTPGRQRGWLLATGGGALVGATIALIATQGSKRAGDTGKPRSESLPVLPGIEILGESTVGSLRAPIVGVGLRGLLQ